MDRSWWTVAILVLVVLYGLYRLIIEEPASPSPVPYWMRASAVLIWLPLMYATGMSVVRILLALFFTNWLFARFKLLIKPLHPTVQADLGCWCACYG